MSLVRCIQSLALLSIASLLTLSVSLADEPIDADVLLIGGSIHLGDGKDPIKGDVAIADGKIVAIGEFELGVIKQRLNCEGLVVSPGFIDLHNHSDSPILRAETRAAVNYLMQGCTTIVTGNCGSGPVDVGNYYDQIDELGAGPNVAHLLPQGSLRRKVMQTERRDATDEELTEMKTIASQAMSDGAWGMATGLIYVPSSYADTDELTEISKAIAEHGGIYVSHIRGEGKGLLDSVNEALQIGRDAGLPVHISHFKSSGKDSWGLVRTAIDIIERERAEGHVITADQYPYIASSTSLSATFVPPSARAGGSKKMLERLASGDEKLLNAIRRKLVLTDQGQRIQIARYRPDPSWSGRRLKEIADEKGIEPLEMVLQTLGKDSSTQIVNFGINEQDVRYVMQQPWVATASDGSSKIPNSDVPHPRNYGTFPRKIGYYSIREGVVPLPHVIRSATGLPADILGMKDRGYLRVGLVADVAVWDPNEIIDQATFESPHQYCKGIVYLFVNGTPSIWRGDFTGALAGRSLRHESSTR